MRARISFVTLLAFSALLTACAGPMSPFGAINNLIHNKAANAEADEDRGDGRVKISFTPERQVLHEATSFRVKIEDPDGVPKGSIIKVIYNGVDVTQAFTRQAERKYHNSDTRFLYLTVPKLRIRVDSENKIRFSYQRTPRSLPISVAYQPPQCQAFQNTRGVASVAEFDPPDIYLKWINEQARQNQINPHFLAGLIAQESGFDPFALSRKLALGLTQITSQGEAEVLKQREDWPRYPGLDSLSFPEIRLAILYGRINSKNEWRLNPALSIEGGATYVAYLGNYWNRPDKKEQLAIARAISDTALSEIILASYNAGPTRVSQALHQKGKYWLEARELKETRKYVRRVVSWCDTLSHRED